MAKRNGNGNGNGKSNGNGNGNGKSKGKIKLRPVNVLGAAVGGLVGLMGGVPGLLMGSAVGYGVSKVVEPKRGSTHARKRSSGRKRSSRY